MTIKDLPNTEELRARVGETGREREKKIREYYRVQAGWLWSHIEQILIQREHRVWLPPTLLFPAGSCSLG